jgi:hypothetical protein
MDTQRNEGQETMNDLVDRLRAMTRCEHDDLTTAGEAADENEKLRAALLRAKEFFLRDEPLAACIEVCAALGDKE